VTGNAWADNWPTPRLRSERGRIKLAMISACLAMPFLMIQLREQVARMGLIALMFVGWTFFGALPCHGLAHAGGEPARARGVLVAVNSIIAGTAICLLLCPAVDRRDVRQRLCHTFMLSSLVFVPIMGLLLVMRGRIKRDVGAVNSVLAERASSSGPNWLTSFTIGLAIRSYRNCLPNRQL
jgi:hypothetical protein